MLARSMSSMSERLTRVADVSPRSPGLRSKVSPPLNLLSYSSVSRSRWGWCTDRTAPCTAPTLQSALSMTSSTNPSGRKMSSSTKATHSVSHSAMPFMRAEPRERVSVSTMAPCRRAMSTVASSDSRSTTMMRLGLRFLSIPSSDLSNLAPEFQVGMMADTLPAPSGPMALNVMDDMKGTFAIDGT